MNKKILLNSTPLLKSLSTSRFIRSLAAIVLTCFAAVASAAPMNYTFNIGTSGGNATGSFSGFDVNANNVLGYDLNYPGGPVTELQRFSIGFGDINLSGLESLIKFFFYEEDVPKMDFYVTNGLPSGADFRALSCEGGCLAGTGAFRVYIGDGNTGFDVLSLAFTPVAAVSAPATFGLFGLGLAGLGWSRRRSQKNAYGIQPGSV